ncbi:phospholipid/cholesterol/gamma-HCH transport system ATP-binding protein [Thermodesulfovibrio aggregans]|uniref:Phospholipid/cholesterol/gamma-HCH transport system ATP-binding protein n=1 Tax=Thermodesulfovibrio aggregans TaxID=86166 RepID=A0A0U9HVH1_9BACT|nr:ATP-binding cassette domain-containing protein [Thermodesulfovibrio aggregans]GAQ94685.1 phospholipid/cholesterol/gamma-HCH transport system ATP-binding protein [Thermodesulfovibrio aggregans]
MIKAFGLTGEFIDMEMDFEIERGSRNVFVFRKEEQGSEFLKLIIGLKNPKKGEVIIMGQKLKELTRDKVLELRKKIGIVFKTGGLISNLKAWENLTLPAIYHKVDREENIIRRGIEILKNLNFKKEPMIPLSELTLFERRLIGIARAFLINPEIVIFEYLFNGLEESEKRELIGKIQKIADGTTLIYILDSERDSLLIEKASIIKYAEN